MENVSGCQEEQCTIYFNIIVVYTKMYVPDVKGQ